MQSIAAMVPGAKFTMKQSLMGSALTRFPEGCDGYMCPECDPYGCSFTAGQKDLQGNVISSESEQASD
jgi:hypothetical protein